MRAGFGENSFLLITEFTYSSNLQYQLVVIIDTARNCANYMKLVSLFEWCQHGAWRTLALI